MKKKLAIFLILVFGLTIVSTTLFSQRYSQRRRLYDPQTVTTITGKIIEVKSEKINYYPIIVLTIETREGPLKVHTAPEWYLNEKRWRFRVGDTITVVGSKITYNNQPILIARDVLKGEEKIELRDKYGTPKWAGRGRGSGSGTQSGQGRGRGRRW